MTLQIGEFECPVLNFTLGFNPQDLSGAASPLRQRLTIIVDNNIVEYDEMSQLIYDITQTLQENNQIIILGKAKPYVFTDYIFEGINYNTNDEIASMTINFSKRINLN